MQPHHIGILFAPLTMAYRPQVIPGESDARSSSLRGRRCYSVTLFSDHNVCTDAHIDELFCTAQSHHQQLQGKDADEVSRGSSDSSASERDDDDDQCRCAESTSDQRRHTVEEMFCTQRQRSTSDNTTCLATTSLPTLQHCCSTSSDAQGCRKQVRSDVMQFVKTTTSEVLKLRRHLKRNKIRTLSDAGEAVYPRQPMIAAVDHCKVMANGAACRDQPPPGDERDQSMVTTMTDAFDAERRLS